MDDLLPKYADRETAAQLIQQNGNEFAVVQNPSYIFPPYDLYPLAPKQTELTDGIEAILIDLDGTVTDTEPMYLRVLDRVAQAMAGKEGGQWQGLDETRDYPNLIGNSVTKHVEYLVAQYSAPSAFDVFARRALRACQWNLTNTFDESRHEDILAALSAMGALKIWEDPRFTALGEGDRPAVDALLDALMEEYPCRIESEPVRVQAGIELYYEFLYSLLTSEESESLIRLTDGVGLFHALIKGWLGEEAANCFEIMCTYLAASERPLEGIEESPTALGVLGAFFNEHPIRVGMVTSCTRPEADAILEIAFRRMRHEVDGWPISKEKRAFIQKQFAEYTTYYDAYVTASDVPEIRLKPHRDLYSLALNRIGVQPESFHRVVAFEDSEAGIISVRAAGIPLACAVPLPETQGHTYEAASYVARGGLPEVLLKHGLFLSKETLAG